jgi:hypothetical protein
MGSYYYFYKEKDSDRAFDDSKYAGIPYMGNFGLDSYNPRCDTCDKKDDEYEFACWGCYGCCQTRYKITRDSLKDIVAEMDCNQDLFKDLMDEINQDYIWIYEDF